MRLGRALLLMTSGVGGVADGQTKYRTIFSLPDDDWSLYSSVSPPSSISFPPTADHSELDDQHGAVTMDFDSEDEDEDPDGASQMFSGGGSCKNGALGQVGRNVSSHGRVGSGLGEAELRAVFKDLDVDGSGQLTVEDLRKVLAKTGQADKAAKYIEQVDVNKDGKVDFEEFLKAWKAGL